MCNCKNITPQSKECYAQQVLLDIPPHMEAYKQARLKNDMTPQISIDPCIVEEIKWLWEQGIITYGCCCGHNKFESMVNVDDVNSKQMLEMGYIMNHQDKSRTDTFKLHSA